MEGVGAQCKERKGSNFAIWQPWFQAAGTIPDMYEKAYFTSIGAIAYENARKTVRFRPITTSDSTMEENSREFDEFAQGSFFMRRPRRIKRGE